MKKFAVIILVCFCCGTGQPVAAIDEQRRALDHKLLYFYAGFEKAAEQGLAERFKSSDEALGKHPGFERNEQNKEAAYQLAIHFTYLGSINRVLCLEQQLEKESRVSSENVHTCVDARVAKDIELFNFLREYGTQYIMVVERCMAVSRRLDLELKYPPYSFLKEEYNKNINTDMKVWTFKIYEPQQLMDCVRSRL